MPLYEYLVIEGAAGPCADCGRVKTVLQKMSDEPLTACGDCGRGLEKVMSRTVSRTNNLAPSNLKEKGFRTLRRGDDGKYVEDPGYRYKGDGDPGAGVGNVGDFKVGGS